MREEILDGVTYQSKTGCGVIYTTVNRDSEGKIIEVFARLGKAGGCAAVQTEAIGRLLSMALQDGISVDKVIGHLKGINCHSATHEVSSCADAVARCLEYENQS